MHSYVYSSPVYNNQDMEATLLSIDRWMDKEHEVYICIYSEILLNCKKEIIPFAETWMDLEIIILSEVNQTKTNIMVF